MSSERGTLLTPVVTEDLESICRRVGGPLDQLAGRTVLVTGAAGFLGGYIVNAMLHANDTRFSEPCRVVCLDNLQTGTEPRLAAWEGRDDVVLLRQSATEPIELDEHVDYVVHAASIASPPTYRRYPLETIDVNVGGTRNLLELARRHEAANFLHLSSSEVYGDPDPEYIPTPETYWGNVSFTGPRACYDESKRLSETLCTIYHDRFGVPVTVVRPFNVYGPTIRLDDGRIIPDLVSRAVAGQPLVLYSDGTATRSFCYVADFVTAVLLLLVRPDSGGEAFNVGNDEEVSIYQVAQLMQEVSGGSGGIEFQQSKESNYTSDNPQRRCPDLAKIKATVPWRPEVSLREGLTRTVRWHHEATTQ
ncbi:MAG: NAD-dependent epimerase/dehydratase family protein [Chloroflexi bacterium]|nr:NAD-dependent epimerase/dehydratase family protein [Chloroflexota bacterium]